MILPHRTIKRLMEEANPNHRVGNDATDTLAETLEEIATTISQKAAQLATVAGRKTIQEEDILLAYDLLEEI